MSGRTPALRNVLPRAALCPAMARSRRLPALLAVALMFLGAGGCTLVKPVTGVVAGPIYAIGALAQGGGCYHHGDGRALCVLLAGSAGVGAVAGLVTGIASDVQALNGRATDPSRNWWNPFATNTMSERW